MSKKVTVANEPANNLDFEKSFRMGQLVWFCAVGADRVPGVIVGLPDSDQTKYLVELEAGTQRRVNPCYFEDRE